MSSPLALRKEKLLPVPAVLAALGMALSYYFYPFLISLKRGHYLLLVILSVLIIAVALFRVLKFYPGERNKAVIVSGILAAALAVGFSLGIASRRSATGVPEFGIASNRVIALSGTLKEDPRSLHGGSGLGVIKLKESSGQGGLRASAKGNVTVFFPAESIPRLKEFGRGAEIYIDGTLLIGERGPLFNASSVHIVKPASGLEQLRTSLRMKLLDKFQYRQDSKYKADKAPVWGPLASALLLGMRDDLAVDLSEGFRNSGCAHILALSGMHLAILSGVLAFLIRRPLGIRGASIAGAAFIIVYVFVAGSQPSLVRSAIMYLIGTISLWGFLRGKPFSLLCMAFIIQLIFQSETGLSLSFILSYLALTGILTLGESFHCIFRGRLPEVISRSLSSSLGAFIITAPVVVMYFDTLRPIGIIVGLLIAPLSALFMVLALIALIASFLPFALWSILDFILIQVYRIFELCVNSAGQVPGLSFSNPLPVLIFAIISWLLILYIQKRDYAYRNSIGSFN